MRRVVGLSILFTLSALVGGHARGDGVAQVMTAKTLPAATVAVIDPESGSSSGGGSTDVRVAPGDVILFKFKYFPVPDKIVRGLQGYLTEYIPDNTEVVGVRITDENGWTIRPRYPGIGTNGCGRPCNRFNSVPSSTGDRNLNDGAISQLYADTGVFYTVDSRLTRNPATAFITLTNGTVMSPQPSTVGSVSGILGASSPFHVHNQWDWIQVRAYGTNSAASENSGSGNTPFRYGSPVAGPGAHYTFEASEPSPGNVFFDDVVGPWQRIRYPGSQIGSGAAVSGSGPLQRMNVDTSTGFDLRPLTPLPWTDPALAGPRTRAVRIALGEVRVGEPGFAEIALRVMDTPLDSVQNADVDCAEVFGGDTSAASDTVRAKDNMWPVHLASPACAFLNLLFDLDVDRPLARTGDTLVYTLHGKNLSINPQTNAVARLRYDSTRVSFVSATGGPANLASCDDGSGFACLRWPAADLAPSDEYTFTATFTVGGGGHVTNVAFANYRSDQLAAPGYTTQAISMVREVAVVRATLDAPLAGGVAGGTVAFTGTISNDGSGPGSYDTVTIVLPAGWRTTGAVTLGGSTLSCASGCTGNTPTYDISSSFVAGDVRAFTFTALIPAGAATGLHDVDLQIWGSQSAFGGSFETYFPDLATVSVGQPRSTPPVVSCPIGFGDTAISGTTVEADGTTIRVYFNGIQRCTTTASGGVWTCSGFVGTFGPLYGGLEVRATADAPAELEGPLSAPPCFVSTVAACADFVDNDGDGLTDFPADPGCASPTDASEDDPVLECSDTVDNDGDTFVDFPADLGCFSPADTTEAGPPQCSDGIDSDGDGFVDLADPGCTDALDPSEIEWAACQDFVDNDADALIDFPDDPGCHAPNDDDEDDPGASAEVKARLLIAFDTSGSMNLATCAGPFTGGDGSTECAGADVGCATCSATGCGNGVADDSRLFKVKQGVSDVVAAFGEVEYGLMRFHQRPVSFVCPSSNASRSSGGWQGAGAAPCPGGFDAGDLLVSFSAENQVDLLAWMDGDSNYPGTPPPGMDLELRGTGTTPLGGILTSALVYLDGVRTGDARAACRPYRVILVTDGAETCGGDPVAAASALSAAGIPVHVIGFATTDATIVANLDAIAMAGGTGSAIFVDDSVALSAAMSSIVTETILAELCNGLDDDCDGLVDEDFADLGEPCDNGMFGTCRTTGVRVCTTDGLGTVCNAPPGTPGTEVCNGADDDCDGLIDDGIVCAGCGTEICNGADDDCDGLTDEAPLPGVGDPCGISVGACLPGTLVCTGGALDCVGETGPTAEVCNGIDDDCDTIVDGMVQECYTFATGCTIGVGCDGVCRTGIEACLAGMFGPCVGERGPSAELCNGLDDDCDGSTDEDFPEVGTPCDNGMMGACLVVGTWQCTADGTGTFCTASAVTPGTEVCNGVDDDCDGLIDEEPLGPPVGDSCGGSAGCTAGTLQCVMGAIECVGSVGGSPEVCNGVDDDCDGFIDEPVLPGVGLDCTDPGFEAIGDTGECEYGLTECVAGMFECVGYVGPSPEVCNGLDDDCDGVGDDFAACPAPEDLCYEAECVSPCMMTEFPCPFGFICTTLPEGDFCLPDPCVDVDCPAGEGCNPDTGLCEDLCAGVMCPPGQVCQNGFCLDCFTLGCANEGDVCVLGPDGFGVCEPDLCAGVTCDPGFYCQGGTCVPLSCDPECAAGLQCIAGECVAPCSDEICRDVSCGPNMTCSPEDGRCTVDPCRASDACPDGFVCRIGCDGLKACVAPPSEDILATSAGGCACDVGERGAPAGGAVLLLVAAALAVRARRRR